MSYGNSLVLTQSEATAAQRTWLFHMTLTADGSNATGLTISGADFQISKAGGAFANAAGTVTELSAGWYKMVFAAADLDTLGTLACLIVEATTDTLRVGHQVTAFDVNSATTALATDGVSAAVVAADAVTEIQSGLATAANVATITRRVKDSSHSLGSIAGASGFSSGVSTVGATKVILAATGTFGGGTITLQWSADPTADSPVWVDTALTLTADGSVTAVLPLVAIRAKLTGGTGADVAVTAIISRAY